MTKYVPKDAHCVLSILFDDLYPKPEWNFVFGLANYYQKVCVFSFARFDPQFFGGNRPINFDNYILYRSCNTLVHEICHTFVLSTHYLLGCSFFYMQISLHLVVLSYD